MKIKVKETDAVLIIGKNVKSVKMILHNDKDKLNPDMSNVVVMGLSMLVQQGDKRLIALIDEVYKEELQRRTTEKN